MPWRACMGEGDRSPNLRKVEPSFAKFANVVRFLLLLGPFHAALASRQSVPLHRQTPQSLRPDVRDFSRHSSPDPPRNRNARNETPVATSPVPQQEQVLLEENHRSATTPR